MIDPQGAEVYNYPSPEKIALDDAVDEWLKYEILESTARIYRMDLELFIKYLYSEDLSSILVRDITKKHILGFHMSERSRKISDNTIRRRIYALRSFFQWAIEEGFASNNPARSVKLPKKVRTLPEVLSFDEVMRIINQPYLNKDIGKRDFTILTIFYQTGMRNGELCNLRISDRGEHQFPFKKKTRPCFKIKGKGEKVRYVPLSKTALAVYDEWLDNRQDAYNDYVFTSISKNKENRKPLTTYAVRALFLKYARQAGIDVDNRKISPHTLRHSFATELARSGWRLDAIREVLGHSCLDTTEIYLHLAREELVEMVDSLSSNSRRYCPDPWN